MLMPAYYEAETRSQDGAKAGELFRRIEATLAEKREAGAYAVEALQAIRALIRNEFSDLTIVGRFIINDFDNFRDWEVSVRYPDSRVVRLTHES